MRRSAQAQKASPKEAKLLMKTALAEIIRQGEGHVLTEIECEQVGEVAELPLRLEAQLWEAAAISAGKPSKIGSNSQIDVTRPFYIKYIDGNYLILYQFKNGEIVTHSVMDNVIKSPKKYYVRENTILLGGTLFHCRIRFNFILLEPVALEEDKPSLSVPKTARRARPDLPRWAEENRPTELLQVRIPPGLKQALEKAAREADQTKTEWVRRALEAYLRHDLKP